MRKYFRGIRNAGAEKLSVKARCGGASLQARRTRNRSDVRESRGIFVNRQHIGNIWGGAPLIFGAPFFCAARGRDSEKPQRAPAPDIFPKAPRSLRRPRDCRKNSPEKNGETARSPQKNGRARRSPRRAGNPAKGYAPPPPDSGDIFMIFAASSRLWRTIRLRFIYITSSAMLVHKSAMRSRDFETRR